MSKVIHRVRAREAARVERLLAEHRRAELLRLADHFQRFGKAGEQGLKIGLGAGVLFAAILGGALSYFA